MSTPLPEFITFTGVDAQTDIEALRALSASYPVEWGILFSPKRQGLENRYPDKGTVDSILRRRGDLRLAAHLCGGHARDVMQRGWTFLDEDLVRGFARCQLNIDDASQDVEAAHDWALKLGLKAILQCRADFPTDTRVSWLFDRSGGRGIEQTTWPQPPQSGVLHGYAGGLSPLNVSQKLSAMVAGATASRFWIDLESGVRDEADRFSIEKCRAVCESVYGAPAA